MLVIDNTIPNKFSWICTVLSEYQNQGMLFIDRTASLAHYVIQLLHGELDAYIYSTIFDQMHAMSFLVLINKTIMI